MIALTWLYIVESCSVNCLGQHAQFYLQSELLLLIGNFEILRCTSQRFFNKPRMNLSCVRQVYGCILQGLRALHVQTAPPSSDFHHLSMATRCVLKLLQRLWA